MTDSRDAHSSVGTRAGSSFRARLGAGAGLLLVGTSLPAALVGVPAAVAATPPSALGRVPDVYLARVKEQLSPGRTGLLTIGARRRTRCAVVFTSPARRRTQPAAGTVPGGSLGTWSWKVPAGAQAGSWSATVACRAGGRQLTLHAALLVGGSGAIGPLAASHSTKFKATKTAPAPQLVVPADAGAGRGPYPNGRAACRWTGRTTGTCPGGDWGYRSGGHWTVTSARGFLYRNATDYAAWLLGLSRSGFGFFGTHGAAVDWRTFAGHAGLTVVATPRVGDIAWWGQEAAGGSGYVAVITAVDAGNGQLTVADFDADGQGRYDPLTIVRHADAYLEPPAVSDGPSGLGPVGTVPPGAAIGRQDVLAAEPNGFGGARYVVGYNDGFGTRFRWTSSNLTREPAPTLMAIGDLNGDGRADFVATDPACGSGHVNYDAGLSDGNGAFTWTKTNLACSPSPVAIGAGDVLGNGRTDIIAAEQTAPSQVQFVVYYNDGTGRNWTRSVTNLAGLPQPAAVAFGDVTGDGRTDIVAAEPGGQFMVGISKGNGTFTWRATNLVATLPVEHLALGNFDGSGPEDIVVGEPSPSGGTQYAVAQNAGSGFSYTWAAGVTGASPAAQIVTGDLNGDGRADVAAANPEASCYGGSSYSVGISRGDGTFAIRTTNLRCNAVPFAIGIGKLLG